MDKISHFLEMGRKCAGLLVDMVSIWLSENNLLHSWFSGGKYLSSGILFFMSLFVLKTEPSFFPTSKYFGEINDTELVCFALGMHTR